MKPIDKLIFGLIFGFSFQLFSLMTIIIWFYLFQSSNVFHFVLPGLIFGILIDILFLKTLINKTLNLFIWVLTGFYIFYNILIYGFFMGFPVFNLIMGVVAGYYFGIRINHKNFSLAQSNIIKRNVSLFTGIIMFLVCVSTGLLAMFEKTLGLELQKMFGLGFEVTRGMIIAIILTGGTTLIVSQYYVTKITMTKTIKKE